MAFGALRVGTTLLRLKRFASGLSFISSPSAFSLGALRVGMTRKVVIRDKVKTKKSPLYREDFLNFVDPEGFEPSAFSMPLRRAPNCAMGPYSFGKPYLHSRFHTIVDLEGFEPSASSVRLKRAPNCATGPRSG